ncbi:MAG: UbiA family prenyltransferase [Candidatus Micrarchaeota archaeon]|nr:UbiA family prenyltransferase [Candidatus Micrarchaeota archaeon]
MGISAYLRLFRIEHALMLCAAVLFGQLISSPSLPPIQILLASLAVPFFLQMGSFALNDFLDQKTDKENKRLDRPLVTGEVSPSFALLSSIVCISVGIAFALLLPQSAFLVAAAFAALAVLYNLFLKDLPLVGNVYIALSMAIPFVFGSLVSAGQLTGSSLSVAAVAFVAGLGREIVKSAEDVKGDILHRGSKSLPAIVGKKNACILAALIYFALLPVSFLPFFSGVKANLLSLGLVSVSSLSFAAQAAILLSSQDDETLKRARKASLWFLAFGLFGYLASIL